MQATAVEQSELKSELVITETLRTTKVCAQVRAYSWPVPVHDGRRLLIDQWFVDLSLTGRPDQPRGRYLERWRRRGLERIGDVLVFPPRLAFSVSHGAGKQTSLSLLLAPELLHLNADDLDEPRLAEGLHISDLVIRRRMWRVAAEIRRFRLESAALIESEALALAADLERRLKATPASVLHKRGGLAPARMRLIEARIRDGLPPPTVSELAQICGLSERQLTRAYLQETGETVGARLAAATLQRAWALLTSSKLPVSEIARRLGFCSSASFAAAFRNSLGCRPRDVRERPRQWPQRR